jgi:hypothetical protein
MSKLVVVMFHFLSSHFWDGIARCLFDSLQPSPAIQQTCYVQNATHMQFINQFLDTAVTKNGSNIAHCGLSGEPPR